MIDLPTAITKDPRYRRIHDEHERHAIEARTAQALYLMLTRVFIIAGAITAITAGLVLYGTEASVDADSLIVRSLAEGSTGRNGLIVVQGIFLAVALFCGYLLGRREPGRGWVGARLRAEEGRLQLARRALSIGHEKGVAQFNDAGSWFLAFMEEQLNYLDAGARRRDKSAFRGMIFAAILVALTGLAGVLTGFDSKTLAVVLAIFGVSLPLLVTAVESWGQATADDKRAKLHGGSWTALNALHDDVPAFQTALAERDLEVALGFADRVFEVLRHDHESFASVQGESNVSIKKESEAMIARTRATPES